MRHMNTPQTRLSSLTDITKSVAYFFRNFQAVKYISANALHEQRSDGVVSLSFLR